MSGRGGRGQSGGFRGRGGRASFRGGGRGGRGNPLHTGGGGGGRGGQSAGGEAERARQREEAELAGELLEQQLGYLEFREGDNKLGYLMNMAPVRGRVDRGRRRRRRRRQGPVVWGGKKPRQPRVASPDALTRLLPCLAAGDADTPRDGPDAGLRELLLYVPGASPTPKALSCHCERWHSKAAATGHRARQPPPDTPGPCLPSPQDGSTFKARVGFAPYFLLAAKVRPLVCSSLAPRVCAAHSPPEPGSPTRQRDTEQEVESYLRRRFESLIQSVDVLEKEDLSLVRAHAWPHVGLGVQPLTRVAHRTTTCRA